MSIMGPHFVWPISLLATLLYTHNLADPFSWFLPAILTVSHQSHDGEIHVTLNRFRNVAAVQLGEYATSQNNRKLSAEKSTLIYKTAYKMVKLVCGVL